VRKLNYSITLFVDEILHIYLLKHLTELLLFKVIELSAKTSIKCDFSGLFSHDLDQI